MSSSTTEPDSRNDAIHALVRHVVVSRYEDLSQRAVPLRLQLQLDCPIARAKPSEIP